MKFLIDAQLPPALVGWLRTKGHEALSVKDVSLRDADDAEIWSYASQSKSIIVTKDEDFAFLASTSPGPRVLWVRIGNVVNRVLLARFETAWPQIIVYLEEGARLVEMR